MRNKIFTFLGIAGWIMLPIFMITQGLKSANTDLISLTGTGAKNVTDEFRVDSDGNIIPGTTNENDLGNETTPLRFRNVYVSSVVVNNIFSVERTTHQFAATTTWYPTGSYVVLTSSLGPNANTDWNADPVIATTTYRRGTIIYVINASTQGIRLQDEQNQNAGSGLSLSSNTITLGPNDTITLILEDKPARSRTWAQIGQSDNQ